MHETILAVDMRSNSLDYTIKKINLNNHDC
jgi:hypothetical protein